MLLLVHQFPAPRAALSQQREQNKANTSAYGVFTPRVIVLRGDPPFQVGPNSVGPMTATLGIRAGKKIRAENG
jgi:hypothetical protein